MGRVCVTHSLCLWLWLLFCFFFQAEDGIRDLTVTGVQTCALPILEARARRPDPPSDVDHPQGLAELHVILRLEDRKSTRLNSSHSQISYAVFCLKKKKP